jgi:hypothetical protein
MGVVSLITDSSHKRSYTVKIVVYVQSFFLLALLSLSISPSNCTYDMQKVLSNNGTF